MDVRKPLPPAFRSLYRLFLRTASAAVLHQPQATKNLRERWRPIFNAGAKVTQELQNKTDGASPEWIRTRESWLEMWNKRLDHTLEFLYTSAQSRGLPHKITRNLGFMIWLERQRLMTKIYRLPKWDPTKQRTDLPLAAKELKNVQKKKNEEQFQDNAQNALDEVIRMAEAHGGLTLGRNEIVIRRWPS